MVTAVKKTPAKAAVKAPAKRITSQTVREHAKRDPSPKWEGAQDWSSQEFASRYRDAMKYYSMESSAKELKPQIINWMGRNDYTKDQIQAFKDTKDWRANLTMGAVAACLLRGMPAVHGGFNQGRSTAAWLRKSIDEVLEEGKHDEAPVDEVKKSRIEVPVVTIQDRIRDQAVQMSEEIDVAIDSWILDSDAFDPKAFKMVSLLRGKGAKAAQSRYIKGFFQRGYAELLELASGNADEQLREGYQHKSRKNIKKMIDFYESIMAACDQIAQEAKILKKPRASKVKPAEELVKKLKFKTVDDKLGVVSVPPAGLIGAQGAVVFNVKTRKLGMYISKSSAGLSVKGTSITEFTDKSFQRTLRKPAEQLKEFREQNTQKRIETWFGKIRSVETVLTGRLNEDVMILKIFK
jgi:hypothetical protein